MDRILDREDYREALKRREELIEKKKLKEASKSSIDKKTGNRIGTAVNVNKSSMAGNKVAAMKQQQEEREKQKMLRDSQAEQPEEKQEENKE